MDYLEFDNQKKITVYILLLNSRFHPFLNDSLRIIKDKYG